MLQSHCIVWGGTTGWSTNSPRLSVPPPSALVKCFLVVSLAPFSLQCSCHTKVWIMDTGNCCQDEWSCFPSYLFQVWHFWAWGCWRWGTQVDFWSWWCCFGVSGQEGWLLMWGGRRGKPNQAIFSFPFSDNQGKQPCCLCGRPLVLVWRRRRRGRRSCPACPRPSQESSTSWSSLLILDCAHFTDCSPVI